MKTPFASRICFLSALVCLLSAGAYATVPVTVFRGATGSVRFEFKISDALGLSDVGWFDMSIGVPGVGVCMVEWHPGNYFYLFADNGSTQLGGYLPGSNVTVSNSQCTLKMATSQATVIAGELYLVADLQFSPGFSGTKTIYAVAGGSQGHNGWQDYGPWVIGASAIPSTAWLTPASGGSGTDQSFQFSVTDTAGFSDIQWANFSIGVPGANSCTLQWNTGNWLSLFLDDGAGTTAGYAGSGAVLSNSRCRVKLATSFASVSSNTLMIAYDISFTGVSSGSQPVYAVAGSAAGNGGWSIKGNWSIPTVSKTSEIHVYTTVENDLESSVDGYTGATGLASNSTRPAPSVSQDAAGDLPSYNPGDPLRVYIRNAAPNSQVWGRTIQLQNEFIIGGVQHERARACPNRVYAQVYYLPLDGACLLGSTDSAGNFVLNTIVQPYGGLMSMKFWVGAHPGGNSSNPASAGDSTVTNQVDNSKAIGATTFWVRASTAVCDESGNCTYTGPPASPPYN